MPDPPQQITQCDERIPAHGLVTREVEHEVLSEESFDVLLRRPFLGLILPLEVVLDDLAPIAHAPHLI